MEQMIWLAPWVPTEVWLSAFQTLSSPKTYGDRTICQQSETMTFKHCCFEMALKTALSHRYKEESHD